jgi:hypothetical protein
MTRLLPTALMIMAIACAATVRAITPREDTQPHPRMPATVASWIGAQGGSGSAVRADTTWYGRYQIIDGVYYARSAQNDRQSVVWTFDRGDGPVDPPLPLIPNGEGWTVEDLTADPSMYFRVIDGTLNLGSGVTAPVISGANSLWIGADKPQSDPLCWICGPGYGNTWCQRITSPPLAYDGTGDVSISFKYFQRSEPCYDGTQLYLRRSDNSEYMLNPYPGVCENGQAWAGGFTDSIASYTVPARFDRTIPSAVIGGPQSIRFVFEFTSDSGFSDEDGGYCTRWGPFGIDDLVVTGGGISVNEGWEDGLGGWTPGFCGSVGHFVDVVDVDCYSILDPCACSMSGNVLEMHDLTCGEGNHPDGQSVRVESPICDLGNSDVKTIFADVGGYMLLPSEDGVFWRPGWKYYPSTCPQTGVVGWSNRVGMAEWIWSPEPMCIRMRFGGTYIGSAGTPVPSTAQKVRFVVELLSDCAAFSVDPCSGVSNPTPLFDNLVVGVTAGHVGPIVGFSDGHLFQDVGSYGSQPGSGYFDPRSAGPANTARDLNAGSPSKPTLCGDSLVVVGPTPIGSDPNSRWEAKLWWRVARRAPFNADRENGAVSRYKTWKDRVSDGKVIDRPYRPQFTWAWMDSAQRGAAVSRDKFISSFREDDDDFVGEGTADNEMIWDDCLYPGTRIEYFVTSNYRSTPGALYYHPDTTGGNFMEFEILPGVRVANLPGCGGTGFNYCAFHPSTLYIDAAEPWPWATDQGFIQSHPSRFYTENALRTVLNGYTPCLQMEGCRIPDDRNWDRYDYHLSWYGLEPPFARGAVAGSNNGMTLSQILGYRTIILSTGWLEAGTTQESDYQLYDQWLISPLCNANTDRQVFLFNGDKAGEVLSNDQWTNGYGTSFLNATLGATLVCDSFNGVSSDFDCLPTTQEYCVRILPSGGGPFSTEINVDALGNFCPNIYGFNVYGPIAGRGNRYYETESGDKIGLYSQITNENLNTWGNYRTAIDGVAWEHLTRRNADGSGDDRCPGDVPSIVAGSLSEIGSALKWGSGVSSYDGIPKLTNARVLAQCQSTWNVPTEADEPGQAFLDRLYANEPNPFNPRTTIKFSTARDGRVTIVVYDVSGRLVRTLVDGPQKAGTHSVVWDGSDDRGRRVGAGVYWAQMKAGDYLSTKKIVVLK